MRSFYELKKNDPLRMAAATAFFTTFALPPILIILFQLFTLFLDRKLVGTELMNVLTETFGKDVALQIRATTAGFRTLASNWYIAVPGFLFLVFVGTTLFNVIKNTLNDIWHVKVKEKGGLVLGLIHRAKSAGAILATGLLFLIGVMFDAFEILIGKNIGKVYPRGGEYFKSALNEIAGVFVVTLWFIVLFRFLANGRPSWKASVAGGIVTGLLFSAGKTLLTFLMNHNNAATIYGSSTSMVLMLLFVFYSSFILYYGASFIKVYSENTANPIVPLSNAYVYRLEISE